MTTKRNTKKAVAEKATNVVEKATVKVTTKKPTVKDLQGQLALAQAVVQAKDNLIESLEIDLFNLRSKVSLLEERNTKLDSYNANLEDLINSLENQSWWNFTKDRIGQMFIQLVGGFK